MHVIRRFFVSVGASFQLSAFSLLPGGQGRWSRTAPLGSGMGFVAPTLDKDQGAVPAAAVWWLQGSFRVETDGKAQDHGPQPGSARTRGEGGGLAVVQLRALRHRRNWHGGDRFGVDGEASRPTHRDKAAMNGAQICLFGKGRLMAGSVSGPLTIGIRWGADRWQRLRAGHGPALCITPLAQLARWRSSGSGRLGFAAHSSR